MSREMEIEYKNLLTKEEYTKLMNHFEAKEEECWNQKNYYYDTVDFQLKERHSALRIRLIADRAEITLKTPMDGFLLETTDLISKEDARKMIKDRELVPGKDVSQHLSELGMTPEELILHMTLSTFRFEKQLEKGLLVLDKSMYGNQTDYEIELEVENPREGKEFFSHLLDEFQIPVRETPNKIQRAMHALKKEG